VIPKPEEKLTEHEAQSALKNIIRDGVASQAMGILTGGAIPSYRWKQ